MPDRIQFAFDRNPAVFHDHLWHQHFEDIYEAEGWPRCASPDCGDKVKDDYCYVVTAGNGSIRLFHDTCIETMKRHVEDWVEINAG